MVGIGLGEKFLSPLCALVVLTERLRPSFLMPAITAWTCRQFIYHMQGSVGSIRLGLLPFRCYLCIVLKLEHVFVDILVVWMLRLRSGIGVGLATALLLPCSLEGSES